MTLIVLAGQSNALGYLNDGAAPYVPTESVKIWVGDRFEIMRPGENTGTVSNPHAWGPEVSFAESWLRENPGETLHLVKSVKGSTGIASDPTELDWSPHSRGEMFDFTAHEIAETGMAPAAILWVQGEQDAMSEAKAEAYQGNLAELFWNMRYAWGNPDAEIVFSELASDLPFGAKVRAGQAANDGGHGLYSMVESAGFTFRPDNLHLSTQSQLDLGNRLWGDSAFLL